MKCNTDSLRHIEDAEYREHEISIYQCNKCSKYVIDARSDNCDGEMLAGWCDVTLFDGITNAIKAIDRHEVDKLLLINIPF